MLVRNIGAPRQVASPTHNYWSEEVGTGDSLDVPDAVGVSLCEQVDVWQRVKNDSKTDKAPVADKAGE